MIKTTIVGYGKVNAKMFENYIDKLEHYLPLYYPNISWQFMHVRMKEGTIKKYSEVLKEKVLVHHPNIVFIELSIDEMYTNTSTFVSLDTYEQEIEDLINEIKSYSNHTGLNGCMPIPILITPLPLRKCDKKEVCSNSRINQYLYRAKMVARKTNCPVVDLFGTMRKLVDYEENYLCKEENSLNEKGLDLFYDMVFIELTRLINYQGVLKNRFVE